jgi:hypothetical protein
MASRANGICSLPGLTPSSRDQITAIRSFIVPLPTLRRGSIRSNNGPRETYETQSRTDLHFKERDCVVRDLSHDKMADTTLALFQAYKPYTSSYPRYQSRRLTRQYGTSDGMQSIACLSTSRIMDIVSVLCHMSRTEGNERIKGRVKGAHERELRAVLEGRSGPRLDRQGGARD